MTNFEKWRLYTDGLISPDNFIDFGFYYLIGAALQRRVWIGPDHLRLYPNPFVVLVADPGIGKGLVIKQVSELLKHHKMADPKSAQKNGATPNTNLTPEERTQLETVAEADYKIAQGIMDEGDKKSKTSKSYESPLLFPVAADATTYEALVKAVSQSIRRKDYTEYDDRVKRETLKIYTHSSLCFCLEEISSLFRRRTEDVAHFLIQAYDCGDYVYDTKTQGKDRIKRCCLSFFGGTTPGFMQSTFDDRLLTEGFSSRTFFIYATQNRKTTLWVPDLTKEQKNVYVDLQQHVKKLAHLFGRVSVSKEDMDWLEEWWKECQAKRVNTSPKLIPYYARKNIHVQKLALAIHFGESTSMTIGRVSFQRAIDVLAKEERTMHLALGIDKSNPLAIPASKILKDLQTNGKKSRKELLMDHWGELQNGMDDLDMILEYLSMSQKIKQVTEKMLDDTDRIFYKAVI